MRKLPVIILLFTYVLSGSSLTQWIKLPELISHFNEHKAGNSQMSFLQFVAMHYGEQQDHDARDKELPFKSATDNLSTVSIYLPQLAIAYAGIQADFFTKDYAEYRSCDISCLYSTIIFQPPRI